ncbi:MAG: hypothetical protein V4812_14170 [Pseudomonadota bacterium]
MQQPHTATPDTLQAALQQHEATKADYLAQRERLTTLGQRLEKHRNAATAATCESERAGEAWRIQLREADGELTKDIKQLKRQELDTRELAEEFNGLVNEMQPDFELCQVDVYEARERYQRACSTAGVMYADQRLDEAFRALLALREAAPLLDALCHRFHLMGCETWYPGTELEQDKTERERADSRMAMISHPITAALATHEPGAVDATRQALALLDMSPLETSAPDYSSAITRQRVRARANNDDTRLVSI